MLIPYKHLPAIAMLDPGSGKSKDQLKKRAARSAIIVGRYDWLRRVFITESWADRVNTSELIERIFMVNERYRPTVFGIEANAQQSLFFDTLVGRAVERQLKVPFHPVYPSTRVEKDFRIRSAIQPIMANGQLFVDESKHIELTEELRTFPMGATKDLVDALASMLQLIPRRTPRPRVDQELQERLAYLREVGAPPSHISRVAQGLA